MNAWKLLLSIAVLTVGTRLTADSHAEDAKTNLNITATESSTDSERASNESSETRQTQATLGLGVEPLPQVLTSHLPDVIGKGRGILVSHVTDDSPAAKAGLREHDVLIRYDDQDLYSPEQLVKRVRNDEPGTEVELEYVRAGKLNTVKVRLGEKAKVVPIQNNWPGFTQRFDVPMIPYKPDFLTEKQDASVDGTEWTRFESMSVMKGKDGKYSAKVKYKGEDGTSIDREYTGTRQEVRDAIEKDDELPTSQKEQLLRSLDDRGEGEFQLPKLPVPSGPYWMPWQRELFSWPDLNF
ncbi:S1C family serine protease [Novipirellula sp. SH528]|uniref:S1C family serine protease n=1 Tax=Novipirellula sp. SH528 TaxID=3454466 RepID=UPI003F9EDF16